LVPLAAALGLRPWGLSFHVGSQQTDPLAYAAAIGEAAMLFTDLSDRGLDLRFLNLGGGFPTRYRSDVPPVDDFADAIMGAMTSHFGNALPDMAIEPGRAIVGNAGVVSSEVVLVSKRNPHPDAPRWVYLDIGRFGGLAETEGEAIRYRLRTPHDGGPRGPVVLAGPTCDGADILYERSGYQLPLALKEGDRLEFDTAGAYVTTYAAQGFNGFAPLAEYYI
jgi:ornithine decarboxylase